MAEPFLEDEQIELFNEKEIEFTTVNRLYCANPTCSAFLGPAASPEDMIGVNVACQDCGKDTCSMCKGEGHAVGDVCGKNDNADKEALLELATEQGWQQCPDCHRMVELYYGCNHMTCVCHSEWCYKCKAPCKFTFSMC